MQVQSKVQVAMKLAELRSIEASEPRRWSVRGLARETGLDPGTIQNAIHHPERTTIGTLARIAGALGCSTLNELVELVQD